jgi:hypothetical protein
MIVTCGCGGRDYDVAPVEGTVTLDGKPLVNAAVNFQPIAGGEGSHSPGPGSYGRTDDKGRYALRTVEPDEAGAVVGRHKVYITTAHTSADAADDSAAAMPKETLPKRWSSGAEEFTVPADGTDKADFAIVSD